MIPTPVCHHQTRAKLPKKGDPSKGYRSFCLTPELSIYVDWFLLIVPVDLCINSPQF